MQVHIFDVALGFCAYIIADNRNTILVDCGHNDVTGFHPADYLLARSCTGIESFFCLNYDEDHLSGLPRLREAGGQIPIQVMYWNPSIKPDQLRALKRKVGPLGPGMSALLEMIGGCRPVTVYPEYTNLGFTYFWNNYPHFTDTNNLSLVLFIHAPGLSIIFPGDLEKAGWISLLQRADFRQNLSRVNIFLASHHGRESGYLEEVFGFCSPDIVIISDETKKYNTQDVDYASHATGIRWNQTEVRKVLTTRKDGKITITKDIGKGVWIQAAH